LHGVGLLLLLLRCVFDAVAGVGNIPAGSGNGVATGQQSEHSKQCEKSLHEIAP
jgi:hypothetical protein